MSDIIDIKRNKQVEDIKASLEAIILDLACLEGELDAYESKAMARITTIKDDVNLYRERMTQVILELYTKYPEFKPEELEEEYEE